jgi:EAL domain-containing protein (putative c-di-GMP-specific phosphodiesterase class I)
MASVVLSPEALLRWAHPRLGLLLPQQFLPLAEESGLSADIGQWVLEPVCAQLSEWQWKLRNCDFNLAVNICARQFNRPEFAAQVEAALRAAGADPNGLVLELNEKLLLDDLPQAVNKKQALKYFGVKFSLDDFGIGPLLVQRAENRAPRSTQN